MTTIRLEVNGDTVTAEVAPRTHLADFLREDLLLTGTHLGCEHGVCGACTVMLDGAPARACLTFAAACDGRRVRTVEGFDDDALMAELRAAFTAEHALQCGYCTPGMLATAHDIITRLPDADEARVREELAGNLCRCTGYAGIVRAVCRVLEGRAGPARQRPAPPKPAPAIVGGPPPPARAVSSAAPLAEGAIRIQQDFTLADAPREVWALFGDPERVARALPGARLDQASTDGRLKGEIAVALGPIRAGFSGTAHHRRDDETQRGSIEGSGADRRSGTRVDGQIDYALTAAAGGTRVMVTLTFSLAGPLAQFTRAGLVEDLAGRLTAALATNLENQLAGRDEAVAEDLGAGGLFAGLLWARIKRLFGAGH